MPALNSASSTQITRQCEFSPCRSYRYTLWREWAATSLWPCSRSNQFAMFIGLNPSTADETQDDPTIRRCVGFARRWGFGALCMTNLFAWRDTKPEKMKKAAEPVGPLNDYHLFRLAREAGLIIAAWGKHGSHLGRADYVKDVFAEAGFKLHALRVNGDGSPEHPLYVPGDTEPRLLSSQPNEEQSMAPGSPKSVSVSNTEV